MITWTTDLMRESGRESSPTASTATNTPSEPSEPEAHPTSIVDSVLTVYPCYDVILDPSGDFTGRGSWNLGASHGRDPVEKFDIDFGPARPDLPQPRPTSSNIIDDSDDLDYWTNFSGAINKQRQQLTIGLYTMVEKTFRESRNYHRSHSDLNGGPNGMVITDGEDCMVVDGFHVAHGSDREILPSAIALDRMRSQPLDVRIYPIYNSLPPAEGDTVVSWLFNVAFGRLDTDRNPDYEANYPFLPAFAACNRPVMPAGESLKTQGEDTGFAIKVTQGRPVCTKQVLPGIYLHGAEVQAALERQSHQRQADEQQANEQH